MPITTYQTTSNGPLIDVVVGISGPRHDALVQAGEPVPTPMSMTIRGLIDTGDSNTVIDSQVIAALQLVPTGTVNVLTPTTGAHPHQVNQYDIGIALVMSHGMQMMQLVLPVSESVLAPQGFQVLIGRDVLAQCLFVYNGKEGYFSLSM